MIARILPQRGPETIDVATRLDDALARGAGDGWRHASLPADLDAYRMGLAALEAVPDGFAGLDGLGQDAVLSRAADGLCHAEHWTGEQMRLWFGDVLADATKIYVAHPATLARMGYSGVGYGAEDPVGFTQLEPGQREAWEPQAHAS